MDMGRCKVADQDRSLHAGFVGLPTKPSVDGFLVWAANPSSEPRYDEHGDLGASGSFEAEGTWRDRGVCVEVKRSRGGSVSV